jgi:hypothetical protein
VSEPPEDDSRDAVVRPPTIEAIGHVFPVQLWVNYRHAPDWFADAVREASEPGHHARRREIVFAVCLADSYLAEWVIASVGPGGDRSYLPSGDRRGVTQRWKDIPKDLVRDGVIPATLDLNVDAVEWRRLVNYRDGLVHANASRPEQLGVDQPEWMPMPSKSELDNLEPGWALGVVVERIRRLHQAVGTDPPTWLGNPRRESPKD